MFTCEKVNTCRRSGLIRNWAKGEESRSGAGGCGSTAFFTFAASETVRARLWSDPAAGRAASGVSGQLPASSISCSYHTCWSPRDTTESESNCWTNQWLEEISRALEERMKEEMYEEEGWIENECRPTGVKQTNLLCFTRSIYIEIDFGFDVNWNKLFRYKIT